jgi:hypothetical protein
VGFIIIHGRKKEEKRSVKRLKNMVAENNHFTRLSGKQRREERIEG